MDTTEFVIREDGNTLSYFLPLSIPVYTTGYRVLRNQEHSGFIKCMKVMHNGWDKLVYDISPYTPLQQLMPTLPPEMFLTTLSSVLGVIAEAKGIGFIQFGNIETSLERIYVDINMYKAMLIYLPIENGPQADDISAFEGGLKARIFEGVRNTPSLQSDAVLWFCEYLRGLPYNIETAKQELDRYLSSFGTGGLQGPNTSQPPPQPPQQTGMHQQTTMDQPLQQAVPTLMPKQPLADKPKKRGLFSRGKRSKKKKTDGEAVVFTPQAEGGATEVLGDVFIPSLVFSGIKTPERVEFLISKPDFVIGKKADSVDGCVAFNGAISRMHCKVLFQDGNYYVMDMGSANGTFLNDKRLVANEKVQVRAGDRIKLANSIFELKPL